MGYIPFHAQVFSRLFQTNGIYTYFRMCPGMQLRLHGKPAGRMPVWKCCIQSEPKKPAQQRTGCMPQ